MDTTSKPYWFITVFEIVNKTECGYPDVGYERCWGFFSNKADALKVLHGNETDLYETVYRYAVLEKYYEGISNYAFERQFFEYNKERNGYFEIDEPDVFKHFVGFGIG